MAYLSTFQSNNPSLHIHNRLARKGPRLEFGNRDRIWPTLKLALLMQEIVRRLGFLQEARHGWPNRLRAEP